MWQKIVILDSKNILNAKSALRMFYKDMKYKNGLDAKNRFPGIMLPAAVGPASFSS